MSTRGDHLCRILLQRATLLPSCCAHHSGRTHIMRLCHPISLSRASSVDEVRGTHSVPRWRALQWSGLLVFGRMRSAVTGSEACMISLGGRR